jgi:YcaO-like protein with predicted kinase domain
MYTSMVTPVSAMLSYTLRERDYDEVLALINGYRGDIGVTRLADITHLDNIGIPVYCAYRPRGLLLQASAGKGISHEQAKCSALMEALEYHHIEFLDDSVPVFIGDQAECERDVGITLTYEELAASPSQFYSKTSPIKWILLSDLSSHRQFWCPADMVYLLNRSFVACHTNGLSSGNTNNESMLHGIYEIIERDAYAKILVNGRLDVRNVGKKINLDSVDDQQLMRLVDMIERSGSKLHLILLPSSIPVYSFWAVIIDEFSVMPVGSFNIGLGCHPDPFAAAIRAVTEAAQSRLVYIHGNREDIRHKAVFTKGYSVRSSISRFFKSLAVHNLGDVCIKKSPCLSCSVDEALANTIKQLHIKGYQHIYAHVLRDESLVFSVTKVFIPGMRCETRFL